MDWLVIVAPSLMGSGGEAGGVKGVLSPDAANGMGDRWKWGWKTRPCVSWINVNTERCNYCCWSSLLGRGGGKHAATTLQVQSNEKAQVTEAFNCIYGEAKCEDCRGLSRMKARPHNWKIWFSLNIAFRLLIRCGRWDHHRNKTWADGFIWTRNVNTWVLLLRRITCYTRTGGQMTIFNSSDQTGASESVFCHNKCI